MGAQVLGLSAGTSVILKYKDWGICPFLFTERRGYG
nr:MAG TPA: Sorting nexin-17, P-selectin domain, PROTEIN TRANSPORT-CELL ADHESION.8A [Caudoviricetes sp.]